MGDEAKMLAVAKAVTLAMLDRIARDASCDICDDLDDAYGDDDPGDRPHVQECPLFGFDHSEDFYRLKAWCHAKEGAGDG